MLLNFILPQPEPNLIEFIASYLTQEQMFRQNIVQRDSKSLAGFSFTTELTMKEKVHKKISIKFLPKP